MDENALTDILEPGDEDKQAENSAKVHDGFWATFKRAAADLPFADDVVAAYYCAMDQETPKSVRGTLWAGLAYFVLPTDLLPDFLIGFGFTDDIAVLTYVFSTMRHHITDAHYDAARSAMKNNEDAD